MTQQISNHTVAHIAQLANIPVTADEEAALAKAFDETLAVVAEMSQLNTTNVEPTHQVTGLENVLRPDVINVEKMFTQEQALANAKQTHNGYFVVPQVIDQDA